MPNIKFTYLYRDGSNYKNWAEVVFSNPKRLHSDQISRRISSSFLVDGLFIAHQVRIREIFLAAEYGLTIDDHCYHEFDSVESTRAAATDPLNRSIGQFLCEIEREAHRGWKAFNQEDRDSLISSPESFKKT